MNKKDVKRILSHSFTCLVGKVSSGKTLCMADLLASYSKHYKGSVRVFGLRDDVVNQIPRAEKFYSLLELEEMKDSIIGIDEVGTLFDLEDRKKRKIVAGSHKDT